MEVKQEKNSPRPEELIVSIWKQRLEVSKHKKPEKVILSMENYRKIQDYHSRLGTLQNESMDYIKKYSIFGLPVFIDDSKDCLVR